MASLSPQNKHAPNRARYTKASRSPTRTVLGTPTPVLPADQNDLRSLPQNQTPTISHPQKGGLMRLVPAEIQFTLFPLGTMRLWTLEW